MKCTPWRAIHGLTLALAATAIQGRPSDRSATNEPPPLAVNLTCGSQIFGTPRAPSFELATRYAPIPLDWTSVLAADAIGITGGLWKVRTQDGSVLMGRPSAARIEMDTALGPVRVDAATVGALVRTHPTGARPPGLVLHFPFDEIEGDQVTDASGNGLHGTLHKGAWAYNGRWAGAVRLTGGESGGSVIRVPNVAALDGPSRSMQLTISCWIQTSNYPAQFPVLVCKGGNQRPNAYGGYEMHLAANQPGQLNFTSGGSSGNASVEVPAAGEGRRLEWAHVACTVDARLRKLEFYWNGLRMNKSSASWSVVGDNRHALSEVSNDLFIGGPDPAHNSNRSWFDGLMDELLLFDRALGEDEIQAIFTRGAGSFGVPAIPQAPSIVTASLELTDGSRVIGKCIEDEFAVDARDLGLFTLPRHFVSDVGLSTNGCRHRVHLISGDILEGRITNETVHVQSLLGELRVEWDHIVNAAFRSGAAPASP